MRRALYSSPAVVAVVAFAGGCYTTKVAAPQSVPGPHYEDRQWFTIGGLVPLSPPAGQQCPSGLAMVESQFSAVDVLIYLGLAVAGGLGGAVACSSGDATAQASCASVGSSLVPFRSPRGRFPISAWEASAPRSRWTRFRLSRLRT